MKPQSLLPALGILLTLNMVCPNRNCQVYGNTWEFGMRVTSDGTHLVTATVYLYNSSDLSAPCRQGVTSVSPDPNFTCDVGDHNTLNPTWPAIGLGSYTLRVGSKFASLVIGARGDFQLLFDGTQFTIQWDQTGSLSLGPTDTWTLSTIPVQINELLSDNTTTIGQVTRWSNGTFADLLPIPYWFDFAIGQHTLKGQQDVLTGEKYNNWNNLADVTNYRSFSINSVTTLISRFLPKLDGVTITTNLVDNPGLAPDSIEFKDPWFIDFTDPLYGGLSRNQGMSAPFKKRGCPFCPNSVNLFDDGRNYLGVFLNQNGAFDPNRPIYFVRAPLIQHHASYSSCFLTWVWDQNKVAVQQLGSNPLGYDMKAMVFKQFDATITAKYKAHLGSSLANITAPLFQRKLARDVNGMYHITYSSASTIWYTKSTDAGSSWSPEVSISQGGSASSPSSATPSLYFADLYSVWHESDNQQIKHLYFRHQFEDGSSTVTQLDQDGSISDMQPCVGVSSDGSKILVMYKKMQSGNRMFYRYSQNGGASFNGPIALFVGTPIYWDSPSIVWSDQRNAFIVSCISVGQYVMYLTFDGGFWGGGQTVAAVANLRTSSQVSVDGTGREYHTWAAYDNSYGSEAAFVRSRNLSGQWSSISEFVPDVSDFSTVGASVSADPGASGASLFFTDGQGTEFYRKTTDGTSWVSKGMRLYSSQHGSGFPSNIAKADPAQVASVLTTQTSTPYVLQFEQKNMQSAGKIEVSSGEVSYQRLEFCDTLSGAIASLQIGKVRVARPTVGDTIDIGFAPLTTGDLRTEHFDLDRGMNLMGDFVVLCQNWETVLPYSISLVDGVADVPIIIIRSGDAYAFTSGRTVLTLSQPIAGSLKDCYLSLSASSGESKSTITQFVDVAVLGYPRSSLGKEEPTANSNRAIPNDFVLSEAYPNPFNPTTTITFEVPKVANVSLVVYDVLGKELATLTRGNRGAGYHSIVWNASSVASGVYYVRMFASDDLGKVIYSKVNKLLLMK